MVGRVPLKRQLGRLGACAWDTVVCSLVVKNWVTSGLLAPGTLYLAMEG